MAKSTPSGSRNSEEHMNLELVAIAFNVGWIIYAVIHHFELFSHRPEF